MNIEDLEIFFSQHPEIGLIRRELGRGKDTHVLVSGLHASARALALGALNAPLFIILDNSEAAQYLYADLKNIKNASGNQNTEVFFFPHSQKRRAVDEAAQIQRTETLTALTTTGNLIVVTYPEAIAETVPAKEELSAVSVQYRVGQEIQQSTLSSQLLELGFERVDFVFQPGQFAVRGSIVDIYSYSHDTPFRLDFFGDEIDSIREFDIEDQLSKNRVNLCEIVGKGQKDDAPDTKASIVDYLPSEAIWVSNDFSVVRYKLEGLGHRALMHDNNKTLELSEKSTFPTHSKIAFDTQPQPIFHKQFDLLTEDIQKHIEEGYKIYILAEQQKQLDRLKAIFESVSPEAVSFIGINAALHEGFVDRGLKICCYTDHQIFERFHRVQMTSENARRGKAIITLREINQLQIGDYVVHSDHGIAKFGGLVTTPVNGKPQEMIKLNYRDGANVFVSIHNLHRISKYKGREGSEPTIARLGSGAWERLKERTKDKVKDIARDLIRLYATRKQQKGFACAPDGYMQHELEASFLYEDTPDQAKATADVKRDLESPMPMDRLVCGDVGFGKT
ncbi:MAG: transcription-repair coupling factor, partial [Paludibacteraceae bacterium]|nr:transcription-repair coupling factor [Paludibacteraceae bacterium]